MNIFGRFFSGANKSGAGKIDEDFYDRLEEALILADVGADLSVELVEKLREEVAFMEYKHIEEANTLFKRIIERELLVQKVPDEFPPKPWTILVIGVNGVGKTTGIGKLASQYTAEGKKVLLAAADTFRAGAIDQLKVWANRAGCDIVAQEEGSDAAAVAYDAMTAAAKRNTDVVIIDTAGRLHNKVNLMNELQKIERVLRKANPYTPNEVLMVVDASTGQNAIAQAEAFNKLIPLTGFMLTKLDGTSKGGIALALTRRFKIPIQKIGVGEKIEDLQNFNPHDFAEALLGSVGGG